MSTQVSVHYMAICSRRGIASVAIYTRMYGVAGTSTQVSVASSATDTWPKLVTLAKLVTSARKGFLPKPNQTANENWN